MGPYKPKQKRRRSSAYVQKPLPVAGTTHSPEMLGNGDSEPEVKIPMVQSKATGKPKAKRGRPSKADKKQGIESTQSQEMVNDDDPTPSGSEVPLVQSKGPSKPKGKRGRSSKSSAKTQTLDASEMIRDEEKICDYNANNSEPEVEMEIPMVQSKALDKTKRKRGRPSKADKKKVIETTQEMVNDDAPTPSESEVPLVQTKGHSKPKGKRGRLSKSAKKQIVETFIEYSLSAEIGQDQEMVDSKASGPEVEDEIIMVQCKDPKKGKRGRPSKAVKKQAVERNPASEVVGDREFVDDTKARDLEPEVEVEISKVQAKGPVKAKGKRGRPSKGVKKQAVERNPASEIVREGEIVDDTKASDLEPEVGVEIPKVQAKGPVKAKRERGRPSKAVKKQVVERTPAEVEIPPTVEAGNGNEVEPQWRGPEKRKRGRPAKVEPYWPWFRKSHFEKVIAHLWKKRRESQTLKNSTQP